MGGNATVFLTLKTPTYTQRLRVLNLNYPTQAGMRTISKEEVLKGMGGGWANRAVGWAG